ncbi:hypothetical protein QYM36_006351 [Artemia franciscana]|uniref:Chorein N-terminal domain-containing protein n=1 Tax=Artemia franciscana TaxID=6661 RepID=A0AA88L9S7_ARTSF|nr:hypothetical protein QYM36_006351 [Artemia franciscana]
MAFKITKKIISSTIKVNIQEYLAEGFSFDLQLLKGKFIIRDIYLKRKALAYLNFPLEITIGHIGSILIEFPFPIIFSKKWNIRISDVTLDESSKTYDDNVIKTSSKGDFKTLSNDNVQEHLDMKLEQAKENVLTTGSSTRQKLVGFFKRNIDLTLRNVNIKSERKIEERPFTVGATLKELLCSSENKKGLFRKTGKINELDVWCRKGHWKSKFEGKLKDCKDKENSSWSLRSLLGPLLSYLFDLIKNNKKENAVDSEEVYREQDVPEEDDELNGNVADIKVKIEDIDFDFSQTFHTDYIRVLASVKNFIIESGNHALIRRHSLSLKDCSNQVSVHYESTKKDHIMCKHKLTMNVLPLQIFITDSTDFRVVLKIIEAWMPPLADKEILTKRKYHTEEEDTNQDNEERQQPWFSLNICLSSLVLNIAHFCGVENHPLVALQITKGSLKANISEVEQQWHFRICKVEIKDTKINKTAYHSILQQVDQATPLDVIVRIYSLKYKDLSDFVKHHMNIKIIAPQLLLFNPSGAVKDILRFLLSIRKTKSEVTKNASKKQTNADPKKIFKTRVTFDVSIAAPIVVIPRDSTEGFVVVFNFSKITLNNHFELVPKDITQGQKVTIKLKNFKLLTGVYKNGKIYFQRSLTKPITFTIEIERRTLKRDKSDYDISIKAKNY